jgi:hypothetical protein
MTSVDRWIWRNEPEHFFPRNSRPQKYTFVKEFVQLRNNCSPMGTGQQVTKNDNQFLHHVENGSMSCEKSKTLRVAIAFAGQS